MQMLSDVFKKNAMRMNVEKNMRPRNRSLNFQEGVLKGNKTSNLQTTAASCLIKNSNEKRFSSASRNLRQTRICQGDSTKNQKKKLLNGFTSAQFKRRDSTQDMTNLNKENKKKFWIEEADHLRNIYSL